ncbi:MAG: hypothetical protein FD167_5296, partial [bacterium]
MDKLQTNKDKSLSEGLSKDSLPIETLLALDSTIVEIEKPLL